MCAVNDDQRAKNPTLLYIMGTARSGTTVLEILLSNAATAVGGGELTAFFSDGVVNNCPCSCGQPTDNCSVWRPIVQRIKAGVTTALDADRVNRAYDRHKGFIRWFLNLKNRKDIQQYSTANWSVIEHLASENNVGFVVDSSKYAARALYLSELKPKQVRVICMTRDAKGMLKSFSKNNIGEQRPRSLFSAVIYILLVSTCLAIAKYRLGNRCLLIRYDDLCLRPLEILKQIECWAHIDLSTSRQLIVNNEVLPIGHIITGNRLRKQKQLKFSPDTDHTGSRNTVLDLLANALNFYQKLLGITM